MTQTWKPIDTAPEDGTEIKLLMDGSYCAQNKDAKDFIVIANYYNFSGCAFWIDSHDEIWPLGAATHWMPLPSGPGKETTC